MTPSPDAGALAARLPSPGFALRVAQAAHDALTGWPPEWGADRLIPDRLLPHVCDLLSALRSAAGFASQPDVFWALALPELPADLAAEDLPALLGECAIALGLVHNRILTDHE